MKIETKGADGRPNGYVLPIWNSRESDYRPDQVYLTVVLPHRSKGPHLHKKRTGYFSCIQGNVKVILRTDGQYITHWLGPDDANFPLHVPPGTACEIRNSGCVPAFVLNMPSPGWSREDQDEWPVEDWKPNAAA